MCERSHVCAACTCEASVNVCAVNEAESNSKHLGYLNRIFICVYSVMQEDCMICLLTVRKHENLTSFIFTQHSGQLL